MKKQNRRWNTVVDSCISVMRRSLSAVLLHCFTDLYFLCLNWAISFLASLQNWSCLETTPSWSLPKKRWYLRWLFVSSFLMPNVVPINRAQYRYHYKEHLPDIFRMLLYLQRRILKHRQVSFLAQVQRYLCYESLWYDWKVWACEFRSGTISKNLGLVEFCKCISWTSNGDIKSWLFIL